MVRLDRSGIGDGKPVDEVKIHEAEPEPVLVAVRKQRQQGNESSRKFR
jgi:hypothetical protein